ncbi:NCS2 family permease [Longirhabdus pacifica]|uniref:NCS2 family permease n=1 Tax=Longirhabdus pacifica TaxID=2305227 RepID=UPI001F0CA096|nr:NCS2 family permease [Longirhabdus pacifica]
MAGLTTFLAMAYILFVNPNMLSGGELPEELAYLFPSFSAVYTATAVAAVIGCLVMGFLAKYPIALAPGMGLNAFFTFTVVLQFGIPWQQALAGVFVSGVIFLILTVIKVREKIINAIPEGLKNAAAAGIGLFIAFIGLKSAGIVVNSDATLVQIGSLHEKTTVLALIGIVVTALMMVRKIKGAIFYGMVITAIVGMFMGIVNTPDGVMSTPPPATAFGALFDPLFDLSVMLDSTMLIVIFTFLFVDFFDTAGTLVGVASQANLMKDNKLPRAGKALAADSIATIAGATMGTSTTTSYVESSAGVAAGGRTGFTAVVTGAFFFIAMFFSPLLSVVTSEVTAPALIMVGVLMASNLLKISWDQIEEAIPAFITVVTIPLTFSIANGIALGFILYPLTKVARGKAKEVHWIMYLMFFVFLAYFIFLTGA